MTRPEKRSTRKAGIESRPAAVEDSFPLGQRGRGQWVKPRQWFRPSPVPGAAAVGPLPDHRAKQELNHGYPLINQPTTTFNNFSTEYKGPEIKDQRLKTRDHAPEIKDDSYVYFEVLNAQSTGYGYLKAIKDQRPRTRDLRPQTKDRGQNTRDRRPEAKTYPCCEAQLTLT